MELKFDLKDRRQSGGYGVVLRLYVDGAEIERREFFFDPRDDGLAGMHWWNHLSEAERSRWMQAARRPQPFDAWAAYLMENARIEARSEGERWLALVNQRDVHSPVKREPVSTRRRLRRAAYKHSDFEAK